MNNQCNAVPGPISVERMEQHNNVALVFLERNLPVEITRKKGSFHAGIQSRIFNILLCG